jgi:predicted small secreted protein
MPRNSRLVLFTLLVISTLLAACGAQAGGGSPAVQAVQSYLQALVAKDATKLANQSCKAWESEATLEMDSFQAVTAKLQGLSCQETGKDGAATLVNCKGAIVATYNGENQNLDLSPRTYKVVQEGGEWRVCGYH